MANKSSNATNSSKATKTDASKNSSAKPTNGKRNYKSKGNYQRKYDAKNKTDETPEEVDMKSKTNDPGWYDVLSPQLIEDAAHINFSWPAGMPIPSLTHDEGFLNANLMALHSIPTIDYGAARTAMWSMYSAMRQVNSGAKNYGPEDMFAALVNGFQMYSALNWAIRFYTMANMYNATNRAIPYVFFEAEGADMASFVNNRADYRAMLNTWIYKFGTVAMPNFMPIFAREAFLYQNIYTEGVDWKDQMYMFVPDMFWTVSLDYTAADKVVSNVVKVHADPSVKLTPTIVDSILNALYTNTVQSEAFNIISGDIYKQYPNNIISVSEVGPDLSIDPIFDENVLEQIKNAKVYNVDINTNKFTYAGTDFMYAPQATLGAPDKFANDYKDVITTMKSDPKAVDIVELTRLIPHFDENGSYITGGSDIIRQVDFLSYNGALGTCDKFTKVAFTIAIATANQELALTKMSQFKYCPAFSVIAGSNTAYVYTGYLHSLDNFGILDLTDLKSIHYAALLNLYYVPSLIRK